MKWTKLTDKMPKQGAWYLTYTRGMVEILFLDTAEIDGGYWLSVREVADWEHKVLYWAEMPEAPC